MGPTPGWRSRHDAKGVRAPWLSEVAGFGLPAAAPEDSPLEADRVRIAALCVCESHASPDHQEEGAVEEDFCQTGAIEVASPLKVGYSPSRNSHGFFTLLLLLFLPEAGDGLGCQYPEEYGTLGFPHNPSNGSKEANCGSLAFLASIHDSPCFGVYQEVVQLMEFWSPWVGPCAEAVIFPDRPLVQHSLTGSWRTGCSLFYPFFLVLRFQEIHIQGAGFFQSSHDDFVESLLDDLKACFARFSLSYVIGHGFCRSFGEGEARFHANTVCVRRWLDLPPWWGFVSFDLRRACLFLGYIRCRVRRYFVPELGEVP